MSKSRVDVKSDVTEAWRGSAPPPESIQDALRESEADLAVELAHAKQLQQISNRLIYEDDVKALYQHVIMAAIALMRSDMASLQMVHHPTGELELLAWKGFHQASARFWEWVRAGSTSSCGAAFGKAQRVIVPDVETCELFAGTEDLHHFRLSGIRAVQSTPLMSRAGNVVGMISTHWHEVHHPSERELTMLDVLARQAADLIERRHVEDALRESEERFRLLVESFAQAVWEANADGIVVADSPSWRAYTGQSVQEMMGYGWLDAIHADDRASLDREWRDAVKARRPFSAEYRVRSADSGWRWTNVRAAPLMNRNGAVRKWVGMNVDITERKQAEEALRESDRRKDEFLATLAHELRNPLAPIRNGLQIARLRCKADGILERTVEMMGRQLNHLVRLVDDLLDVGRITSGHIELRRETVALTDALAGSIEISQALIDAHQHELIVNAPEALFVNGDLDRLTQIFSNLLSNGAKYTERGGRICITVRRELDEAVVDVTDTGIGIRTEDIPRVFDLFSQVRAHQGRSGGGLGIGLSLVRSLVSLHGGTVTAHSAGPGTGSTFTVRLPLAAADVACMTDSVSMRT